MGKKLFIGVGGKAHKVKKIYLGGGGAARKVRKGYIGVNGKVHQFFSSESARLRMRTMVSRSNTIAHIYDIDTNFAIVTDTDALSSYFKNSLQEFPQYCADTLWVLTMTGNLYNIDPVTKNIIQTRTVDFGTTTAWRYTLIGNIDYKYGLSFQDGTSFYPAFYNSHNGALLYKISGNRTTSYEYKLGMSETTYFAQVLESGASTDELDSQTGAKIRSGGIGANYNYLGGSIDNIVLCISNKTTNNYIGLVYNGTRNPITVGSQKMNISTGAGFSGACYV